MGLFVFILSLTIIGDMSRTGIISISYWMDREIGTERLRVIELASNRDRARMWCLEITHIPRFSGFHYTLLFKPCIFSLTRTHWLSCKTIRHRARKTLRNHIICPLIRRMILPPIRQKTSTSSHFLWGSGVLVTSVTSPQLQIGTVLSHRSLRSKYNALLKAINSLHCVILLRWIGMLRRESFSLSQPPLPIPQAW